MSGGEDSQWVEVPAFVRAVTGSPATYQTLEVASGGGRLTAFISGAVRTNLASLVDSQVRVRGVCGSWFNRTRQLFGVRLVVPRAEDIIVEEPAPANALDQAARPIGDLLRFAPHASRGHRVKVAAVAVLQQPGRGVFVQDDQHGMFAQTRQLG